MTNSDKITAEFISALSGIPVYIATRKYQKKKHHKTRINKKWAKQYGFYEHNLIPHGQAVMIDGVLWMTQKDFDNLKLTEIKR